jgi:twitching motility protein PilT
MLTSYIQGGRKDGMQMMDDALWSLVEAGTISAQDAYMKATEKARFEALLDPEDVARGS